MRLLMLALVASILAGGNVQAHDSEFCRQLTAFETASFDQTGDEKARWIEMHWRGSWLNFETGWGITCLHSDDEAASLFCEWLPKNSSYEFAEIFARKVLECHGFSVPPVQGWKGQIELWDGEGRYHYLLIDFDSMEGETGAVRFVSVSDEATDPEIETRSLKPMPPMETHDR